MPLSSPPFPFVSRLARVRTRLSQAGADVFVVTNLNNIRYLTGFAGSAGILVLTASGGHLLIDGRYEEIVREGQSSGLIAAIDVIRVKKYDPTLIETLSAGGWQRLAFEGDHTTVAQYGRWVQGLPGVTCTPVYDWVEAGRIAKDDRELAILRRAAVLLSGVASALGQWVAVGKSEREVAGDIDAALRRA